MQIVSPIRLAIEKGKAVRATLKTQAERDAFDLGHGLGVDEMRELVHKYVRSPADRDCVVNDAMFLRPDR